MKKIYKLIASGMFIGFFAVLFSEFVDDLQYQKKIPVKYLLDGTYEGNDDTFDYYKLDHDSVAISLRNDSSNAISIPETAAINGTNYKVTGIYRDAFKNKKIASIIIPKSITVIDYEAFMSTEFTSNTKVEIPYSVTQMGTACFFKSNITEIYFSDGVTQNITSCDITTSTDESETTKKSNLKEIPDFCFAKCTSLKNISFSTSLTTIKEHAFEYCSSISTLAFLTGLSYIGSYAFNYCSSLSAVYIPSTMVTSDRTIEEFAFLKCNNSLNFYVSCTSIDAFNTNNKYWNRKSMFDGNVYNVNTQTSDIYANGLWLYEINNNNINIIKFIGEIDANTGYLAFPNAINNIAVTSFKSDCLSGFESQIQYLFFPKGLTSIPDNYFSSSFSKLVYVGCVDGENCFSIPTEKNVIDLSKMESLINIGKNAFKGDDNFAFRKNVTKIKLPANLEKLWDYAFYNYSNCEELSFATGRNNTNDFWIGSYAFYNLGANKETNIATSEIVFPKQMIHIWSNVFQNAKCIKSVKFEGGSDAGNLTIHSEAFFDCSSLESLIIEDRGGTTTIDSKAFAQWNGNYRDYTYKPSLQTVYLPSNISISGSEAFARQIRCTFYFSGSAPSGFKDTTYYFMNKQDETSDEISGTDDMTYNSDNIAFKLDFSYHCGIYENISLENDDQSKNYILYNNGDLSYVLNKTDNTAVVSRYHFDMQSESDKTELGVNVPEKVSFNNTEYIVTEIGTGAFGNSDSYDFANKNTSENTYRTIKKVTLPNTIKKIGHYAFFRCVGLEEVGYSSSGSTTLTMPTALESIGEMAFALSGIKYIDSLNSNCDFLMYSGSSQISNAKRNYGSPFLNCPQLEYISLTSKDNSKLKLYNNSALCDSNGYILVVFPKYTGNDKSFVSTKFYYGAYRCVSWIKELTISDNDYPNSVTDITPQAIFAGYTSKKSIREKCRFKSRVSVFKMDNVGEIETLKLTFDSSNNTFNVPKNFIYGTKIKKLIIPYGGGNGTFPANLLEAVSAENNSIIFQVQQNSKDSTTYTNAGETPKYLDLTNCGYTSIGEKAFYNSNLIEKVNLSGIKTIYGKAFYNSSVQIVNGCNNLQTIGDYAFYKCSNLKTFSTNNSTENKIEFANTLAFIGERAFEEAGKANTEVSLIIPNSVTNIGQRCFRDMNGLTKVEFQTGSQITEIPNQTFDSCDKLTEFVFPDNLTKIGTIAFWGCGFKQITIPDSVITIDRQAFDNCNKLQEITIPKNVTIIGSQAFNNCYQLQSLNFAENNDVLIDIGDNAFSNCTNSSFKTLNLTGRKFSIGSYAFSNCPNLESVVIGSGVIRLWNSVFSGDTKINNITFESGDETLYFGDTVFSKCAIITLDFSNRPVSIAKVNDEYKSGTFKECTKLTKVIFGTKDAYIGTSSFEGCTALNDLTLGSGVKTIAQSAFKNCTGLTSLNFSDCTSLTEINGFEGCTALNSVDIGIISQIGERSFYGCTALTSLDFKNVTSIGSRSFANSGLTSINITSDLTSLGNNCFEGCTSLVNAKFSNKSFILSDSAFKNCTKLKSVIFLGSTDNGYGDKAFEGCSSLVLVVLNSGFNKSLDTQIFIGLTQFNDKDGTGIVCLTADYDTTGLGQFTKISDTFNLKIAYTGVPPSSSPDVYIWAWADEGTKESVIYHLYNDSSTTTLPDSLIKRKVEETSY